VTLEERVKKRKGPPLRMPTPDRTSDLEERNTVGAGRAFPRGKGCTAGCRAVKANAGVSSRRREELQGGPLLRAFPSPGIEEEGRRSSSKDAFLSPKRKKGKKKGHCREKG